jgi:hypothetical protein
VHFLEGCCRQLFPAFKKVDAVHPPFPGEAFETADVDEFFPEASAEEKIIDRGFLFERDDEIEKPAGAAVDSGPGPSPSPVFFRPAYALAGFGTERALRGTSAEALGLAMADKEDFGVVVESQAVTGEDGMIPKNRKEFSGRERTDG